jgi:hypothetical protein
MNSGISWTISVLLAIALSVVGNLITPSIRDYLASRSANRARKRIAQLQAELDVAQTFTIPGLIVSGYRSLLKVLGLFLLGSLIGSFAGALPSLLMQGVQALLYVMSLTAATTAYRRLRPYDKLYRAEVEQRLQRLRQSVEVQQ